MLFKKLCAGVLISVMVMAVTGCQSARKALNMNTSVVIQFAADESINPDADDRASPVVIHVFKLADDRQFSREDFLSLYEGAGARLGKDLIDSLVLKELTPGETRSEVIELSEDVKFIGLMAEFIQYRDAEALLALPVLEHNQSVFEVELSKNRISVAEPVEEEAPTLRYRSTNKQTAK